MLKYYTDVYKLFKGLHPKASTGEDKIPPKLVKLAEKSLISPLTNAINSSIRSSIFPHKAKRAAVTPLDKGGKDKTTMGNYRLSGKVPPPRKTPPGNIPLGVRVRVRVKVRGRNLI